MYLLIDSDSILPPAATSCFRDVVLYASTFSGLTPVVECQWKDRDVIWHWLKSVHAFDFVEDLVNRKTLDGVKLGRQSKCNICVDIIDYNNLEFIVNRLKQSAVFDPYSSHAMRGILRTELASRSNTTNSSGSPES